MVALLGGGAACSGGGNSGGGGDAGDGGHPCSPTNQTGCAAGKVCEEVQGGMPACFQPIAVQGKVIDALSMKGIAGARVVARDVNEAAVSTVAITKADGTYSLDVPAMRDAQGKPVSTPITLRADAMEYQTFPEPPRVALPVDLDTAAGTPPVVASPITDIALLPLQATSGLGSIAGTVVADHPGGTLITAGAATGIADFKGDFVVFNVPAGMATARGYIQGLNITPATVSVTAGKQTTGVTLKASGAATASVSGSVQIVNGNGHSVTSVVLAVDETFVASAARGEVPVGLRVEGVTGSFTFKDVPDGTYDVLAAFENDGLVRDPDTSIAGTSIVKITVMGASQTISQGFKVTGALDVISPGASKVDVVSGTPTFTWVDDAGEDQYQVYVFDAFGNDVWKNLMVPPVNGGGTASATYGGPALKSGMIYQFKAISLHKGTPISTTEDLKGVFQYM